MEWIKVSQRKPYTTLPFLYFDGENIFIGYRREHWDSTTNTEELRTFSHGYYCNRKGCKWISDDCYCPIEESPDHYWMPLPNKPS